jgi:threonine aldolase
MRQAGFLAAAGLHALQHHVERLAEDHANARFLAKGLEGLGLTVGGTPETKMVMFDFADTLAFVRETRARHLLINPTAPGRFRAVTHLDISTSDLEEALERLGAVLAEIRGGQRR